MTTEARRPTIESRARASVAAPVRAVATAAREAVAPPGGARLDRDVLEPDRGPRARVALRRALRRHRADRRVPRSGSASRTSSATSSPRAPSRARSSRPSRRCGPSGARRRPSASRAPSSAPSSPSPPPSRSLGDPLRAGRSSTLVGLERRRGRRGLEAVPLTRIMFPFLPLVARRGGPDGGAQQPPALPRARVRPGRVQPRDDRRGAASSSGAGPPPRRRDHGVGGVRRRGGARSRSWCRSRPCARRATAACRGAISRSATPTSARWSGGWAPSPSRSPGRR